MPCATAKYPTKAPTFRSCGTTDVTTNQQEVDSNVGTTEGGLKVDSVFLDAAEGAFKRG